MPPEIKLDMIRRLKTMNITIRLEEEKDYRQVEHLTISASTASLSAKLYRPS